MVVAERNVACHVLQGRSCDLPYVSRCAIDAPFSNKYFLQDTAAAREVERPKFLMVKV